MLIIRRNYEMNDFGVFFTVQNALADIPIDFHLNSRAELIFHADIGLTKLELETSDSEDSASTISEDLVSESKNSDTE